MCRYFEAIDGYGIDFSAAADSVVWLAARGFPIFPAVLEPVGSESQDPSESNRTWAKSLGSNLLDIHNTSVVQHTGVLCDLGMAEAGRSGFSETRLLRGKALMACLVELDACRIGGFEAAGWWLEDAEQQLVIGRTEDVGVSYSLYPTANMEPPLERGEATVVCSSFGNEIDQRLEKVFRGCEHRPVQSASSVQLEDRFEQSLMEGVVISIDDYHAISRTADRVLVASSYQSRRGAGE